MRIVVGIFEAQGRRIALRPVPVPAALEEDILVGLALRAERKTQGAPDDRTGESPLRAISIGPQLPVIPPRLSEQLGLQPKAPDIPVLPDQGGVEKGILVAAVAGHELRRRAQCHAVPQILVPLHGRVDRAEGPAPEPEQPVAAIAIDRTGRMEMDGSPGRIFLGRLQAAAFLPVEKGDRADAGRRETAQVHLHVLRIVDLDPVQEYTHMLTAKAPDIDGLEPADAAIVLDLHAGEMPQHFSHLGGRRDLRRQIQFFYGPHDGSGLHGVNRRRMQGIRFLGPKAQRSG